jgi:hypothetical protein
LGAGRRGHNDRRFNIAREFVARRKMRTSEQGRWIMMKAWDEGLAWLRRLSPISRPRRRWAISRRHGWAT